MSCDMWFGTKEYSQFIPTPLSGADVSPEAWGSSGTLITGDGYALNSFNSHKEYSFSWRSTSARETAQMMKSYFDGSFGRGKLYFLDPLTLTTNILPARWADPSITANFEGPSLVPGVEPSLVPTSNFKRLKLPVNSASYNLNSVSPFDPANPVLNDSNSVYIPVADGYNHYFWAYYESSSPDAGVYLTYADGSGKPTAVTVRLTPLGNGGAFSVYTNSGAVPGNFGGVFLHVGKMDNVNATVTIAGLMARSVPATTTSPVEIEKINHWVGGQGNAGVRFAGPPTYINNSGINGGQVEFAATFIESVL